MTTLGKILVFVNLVFSLITGALIVTVFVTRTNWKTARDNVARELEVVKADRKAWIADVDRIQNAKSSEIAALKNEVAAATDKANRLQRERDDNQLQLAREKDKNMQRTTDSASAAAQQSRLQMEVTQLHTDLSGRDQIINRLEAEKRDFRNQKTSAELALKSSEDRNGALLAQLETVSRENERLRAGGATAPAGGPAVPSRGYDKAPPPEDVRGIVKATDAESGLVTISIGSDAGINKGHTLEVYRLKPRPTYVGTMRILDVRPNEAVGKLLANQRRGPVMVGDEVASEIMSRR